MAKTDADKAPLPCRLPFRRLPVLTPSGAGALGGRCGGWAAEGHVSAARAHAGAACHNSPHTSRVPAATRSARCSTPWPTSTRQPAGPPRRTAHCSALLLPHPVSCFSQSETAPLQLGKPGEPFSCVPLRPVLRVLPVPLTQAPPRVQTRAAPVQNHRGLGQRRARPARRRARVHSGAMIVHSRPGNVRFNKARCATATVDDASVRSALRQCAALHLCVCMCWGSGA